MPNQLNRIHRVRTLQLTLARADEARANAQVATESALSERIAQLAGAVARRVITCTKSAGPTEVNRATYREFPAEIRLH